MKGRGINDNRRCLAFLQNMWVRDPVRVRHLIKQHGENYRLRFMEYALFAGCLTGRRIKNAFDESVLEHIRWEESTREICGDARHVPEPDLKHIAEAVATHKPEVVLTFGWVATDAVRQVWKGKLLQAPHPAARQASVPGELAAVAAELRVLLFL